MSVSGIDELNNRVTTTTRSIPYEQYFGEMEITDEQKEDRISLAKEFEPIFLAFFVLVRGNYASGNQHDIEYYNDYLYRRLYDVVETRFGELNPFGDYLNVLTEEIVNTTVNSVEKDYFTSTDRAMYDAENEANTFFNMFEHSEAIKSGFTRKTWVTMKDQRVRHTHSLVNGEEIGIYDFFMVGEAEMLYPKDTIHCDDAREIANCRCSVRYIR